MDGHHTIKVMGRIPFTNIIKLNKDNRPIILSHQNKNNLNNLYFDSIENGIPLVHNSSAIKDIGWFYEDNNIYQIINILNTIYNSDESFIKSTLISSYRKLIEKFSPYSYNVIQSMKRILDIKI